MSERDFRKLATRLSAVFDAVYLLTNRAGELISPDFQRLPPRTGSEYYKYIHKPVSFHQIGRQIKRGAYHDAQSFIDDLAQVSWNARHFNEPGLPIYENALVLDKFIRETAIPRLAASKTANAPLLHYPDLGPLDEYGVRDDDASQSPFVKNEDYDEEELQITHRYGAHRNRNVDGTVRRGRPPIIDKPYELRIKTILKLFKRVRHPDDELHILSNHFERLPDKSVEGYYDVVRHPISLHEIRARVRLRKYGNVQQFLDDLSLMISNAKLYYADPGMASDVALFERHAEGVIAREMARPDSDFSVAVAGYEKHKTPLDTVAVNGHSYKVGDWVLIRNPNDAAKPICGQIFRLWSVDGVEYTNVCWYIRPEQTCHRVDRLFYKNEVCKTGEYLDHRAEDILSPCYVIFLTHYQKGDIPPSLLPPGAEWFICEFRYNASTYAFNRIRTWKACLPDEIRHVDQPIVPIHEPRKLIKYDSPIRHLLPAGGDDDITRVEPQEGPHVDGPPIVGAVFSKPPYTNDELGQCSTSPNVAPAPEYDDPVTGRKAYIFTPVSQLKNILGAGIYSSSGTRQVAANYIPGQMENSPTPFDRYKDTPPHMGGFSPVVTKPMPKPETITGRETTPLGGLSVATSAYSAVIPGGIVSYVEKKEEGPDFANISESLITSGGNVWFRAPPAKQTQTLLTPVGHSARYLAWKLRKANRA